MRDRWEERGARKQDYDWVADILHRLEAPAEGATWPPRSNRRHVMLGMMLIAPGTPNRPLPLLECATQYLLFLTQSYHLAELLSYRVNGISDNTGDECCCNSGSSAQKACNRCNDGLRKGGKGYYGNYRER